AIPVTRGEFARNRNREEARQQAPNPTQTLCLLREECQGQTQGMALGDSRQIRVARVAPPGGAESQRRPQPSADPNGKGGVQEVPAGQVQPFVSFSRVVPPAGEGVPARRMGWHTAPPRGWLLACLAAALPVCLAVALLPGPAPAGPTGSGRPFDFSDAF